MRLEKDIIYSINNRESTGAIIYKKGGFYTKFKGILHNFAILTDDNILLIRIDVLSYPISKRVFRGYNEINKDYTICLGTDRVSVMLTSGGYSSSEFTKDISSLFHLYNKNLMKIFDDNNISFKELIFNTVEYFDVFDYFTEMITNPSRTFWSRVHGRYDHTYNWNTQVNEVKLNELELRELDEGDWIHAVMEKKRTNTIDSIFE